MLVRQPVELVYFAFAWFVRNLISTCSMLFSFIFIRPINKSLNNWKGRRDRKVNGIWMGPPPSLLTKEDMLIGDVIFCGDTTDRKKAELIKAASAGNYVHCALYVGRGKVVDVVPGGVRLLSLTDFISRYSYLAVTRCPGNAEDRRRRREIAKFARLALQSGVRGYGYIGAALAPVLELIDLRNLHLLWRRQSSHSKKLIPSGKMFCSEFIIEAYIACGYVQRGDPYLLPRRRTPSGLAEENIFSLIGFISSEGWNGVSPDDHFLGGSSWVLTEEGRSRLRDQDKRMLEAIRSLPYKDGGLPNREE
jgi:hypothetical protein